MAEGLEFLKIIILTNPALTCPKAAGGSEGFSKKACVSWGYYFRLKFREGRLFCSTRVSGKTGTWKELDAAGRMWTGELLAWEQGWGRRRA